MDQNEADTISEALDMLMFCGLVLSSTPLWTFPAYAVTNGGVYFIIIYLVVAFAFLFPLLHLEIFVGQRHQTDVCKVFRSYGRAYEGFGVLICIFTFLISQYSIQDSYVVIVHLGILLSVDIETLLSCRSKRYEGVEYCASLLNHMRCQPNVTDSSSPNRIITYSFRRDKCISVYSRSKFQNVYNIEYRLRGSYADSLPEVYYNSIAADIRSIFHVERLFVYWGLFLFFVFTCFLKVSHIRKMIAFLYVAFLLCFLSSAFAFLSFTDLRHTAALIWYATTPESLLSFQTYANAVHLAVNSGGVGFCGVMSAASLRDKRKNSYRLAAVMLLSNILISLLSCSVAASITGSIMDTTYNRKYMSPRKHPAIFVIGLVTEAVLHEKRNRFAVVILYVIANIIAKVLPFFAPLITAAAFIRSRYRCNRNAFSTRVWILVTVCIAGFAVTMLRTVMPLRHYLRDTVPCVRISYDSIVSVIMVFVFVLFYGEFEYMQDIWELYPEDEPRYFSPRPTSSLYTALYYVIPYISMFLAIMGIAKLRDDEHEEHENHIIHELLIYGVAAVIVIYFLTSVHKAFKTNEWSFLFCITPDHPSYARIHYSASTTKALKENGDQSERSQRSRRSYREISRKLASRRSRRSIARKSPRSRRRKSSHSKRNSRGKNDAHNKETTLLITPLNASKATSTSVPGSTNVGSKPSSGESRPVSGSKERSKSVEPSPRKNIK